MDAAVPFIVLFIVNVIILISWHAVSRLEWQQIVLKTDYFENPLEIVGVCTSTHSQPHLLSLIGVDILALLLACHQAYKARNIDTALSESSYVAMAMISIFQTLLFTIPMLVWTRHHPSAHLLIFSSAICLVAVVPNLFIFIPKWYKLDASDVDMSLSTKSGSGSKSVPSFTSYPNPRRRSVSRSSLSSGDSSGTNNNHRRKSSSIVRDAPIYENEKQSKNLGDDLGENRSTHSYNEMMKSDSYHDHDDVNSNNETVIHDNIHVANNERDDLSIYSEDQTLDRERFESDLSFALEGEPLVFDDPEIMLEKDSTISFANEVSCIERGIANRSSLMSYDDDDSVDE